MKFHCHWRAKIGRYSNKLQRKIVSLLLEKENLGYYLQTKALELVNKSRANDKKLSKRIVSGLSTSEEINWNDIPIYTKYMKSTNPMVKELSDMEKFPKISERCVKIKDKLIEFYARDKLFKLAAFDANISELIDLKDTTLVVPMHASPSLMTAEQSMFYIKKLIDHRNYFNKSDSSSFIYENKYDTYSLSLSLSLINSAQTNVLFSGMPLDHIISILAGTNLKETLYEFTLVKSIEIAKFLINTDKNGCLLCSKSTMIPPDDLEILFFTYEHLAYSYLQHIIIKLEEHWNSLKDTVLVIVPDRFMHLLAQMILFGTSTASIPITEITSDSRNMIMRYFHPKDLILLDQSLEGHKYDGFQLPEPWNPQKFEKQCYSIGRVITRSINEDLI